MKGFRSAAIWSLAQTVTRVGCGFLSIKVTAVMLGPAGLALTGQLGNFITLLQATLGNGTNTALVKMVSESQEAEPERAAAVAGTALRLLLAVGAAAMLVLLVAHRPLSVWLFGDEGYWPVLVVAALLLPVGVLGQLQTALLQAHRRFDLMSIIGITATVLSALVFISMCWAFGLWGGLIGTALVYPLIFLIGLGVSRRTTDGRLLDYWRAARAPLVGSIVSFYPMLLVHSAAQPLSLLLMRDTMIEHFGPANAGIWQASVRLSDMYTMVVLAALSMYSLPTLSAARGPTEFRHVLVRLVGGCLAVGMAAALTLFLARDLVVHFVFTHEFATVRDLWPWQLLGDVFLLAGWPMRSALTARQRSVTYMTIEAAIGVGLVVGTRLLVTHAGTLAASMAYALVWSTTFFVLLVVHWRTWQARTDGVPT